MNQQLTNNNGLKALQAFTEARSKAILRKHEQNYLKEQLRSYNRKILWEYLEINEVIPDEIRDL